jgi:threonylcarbamoyladenosine tRNA methylthiotransferase MtaB
MRKVAIQSFGCRVNQAEAFAWGEKLRHHGWELTEDIRESAIILVNTCTLTHRADRDVRHFLRRLAQENPGAQIIVTGCLAERAPEMFADFDNVVRVYPNQEKGKVLDEFLSQLSSNKFRGASGRAFRSRAFLKIQDGCNFRCTFCIVPSVRGRSVSVPSTEIITQIEELVAQGFKEIILSGVHLGLYGRDLKPRRNLLSLLQEIEKKLADKDVQLRLGTLDIQFLDDQTIHFLTTSPVICHHFHFSLQSGSPSILKRMGRSCRPERYTNVLLQFAEARPEAALGADILVGFPGESEEEFNQTRTFLAQSPLTYFHVFSYSPRPGTPAAQWSQIPEEIKKRRTKALRHLSDEKNFAFRQRFINQEREAIVIRKKDGNFEALTSNYIKLIVPAPQLHPGEKILVKIVEVTRSTTKAELIRALK